MHVEMDRAISERRQCTKLANSLRQTPQHIADSVMRLLITPEYEGQTGRLFSHIMRFKPVTPGQKTNDPAEGKRLWDLSERLIAKARTSKTASLSLA
jgi:hypothetical protein